MKKLLLIIIPVLLLAGIAFAFTNSSGRNNSSNNESQGDQTAQDSTNQTTQTQSTEEETVNKSDTGSDQEESSNSSSVEIKDFAYSPNTITIKAGATVSWTNQDTVKHNVAPDEETSFFQTSELLAKGETYSATFDEPGTYTYHCSPHPNMKGTVVVTE